MTIKQGIKELIKMFSNEPSFFSKKRFIELTTMVIIWHGAVYSLATCVKTVQDFAIWVIALTPFCAYNLYQTQKEKKPDANQSQPIQ